MVRLCIRASACVALQYEQEFLQGVHGDCKAVPCLGQPQQMQRARLQQHALSGHYQIMQICIASTEEEVLLQP